MGLIIVVSSNDVVVAAIFVVVAIVVAASVVVVVVDNVLFKSFVSPDPELIPDDKGNDNEGVGLGSM